MLLLLRKISKISASIFFFSHLVFCSGLFFRDRAMKRLQTMLFPSLACIIGLRRFGERDTDRRVTKNNLTMILGGFYNLKDRNCCILYAKIFFYKIKFI